MRQYKKNILLNRFLISLVILIFIRLGTFLPIPEIDHKQLIFFCKKNSILEDFIQLTTGNNLFILGLFRLNIFPYINASILSQILLNYFPSILNIQKDNNHRFEEILQKLTRIVTLFIALFQSINITYFLKSFLPDFNIYLKSEIILVLTTGAMIVLWLSEFITEYGLGNGPSLIIFTNIISNLPKLFINIRNQNIPIIYWLNLSILLSLIICSLILLQEGSRIIPLISSKQLNQNLKSSTKMSENYIPLKLNQVGIMPIVLTSTILGIIPISWVPLNFIYYSSYFILILIFNSLYSTLGVNPLEISNKLQTMSVSIPGIRPGKETLFYLKQIIKRLTFLSSLSIAFIAIIPHLIKLFIPDFNLNETDTSSLLILISTISDISREIQSINFSNIYNIKIINGNKS